jgi:hypothetical protein
MNNKVRPVGEGRVAAAAAVRIFSSLTSGLSFRRREELSMYPNSL